MKEDVLISVEVARDDQDFQQLVQLKGVMSGIKEEQKAINEKMKEGKITRHEHALQTSVLEANYKKLNATYSETQRKITGLKSPFQDLKEAIKDQAAQVNIAGFSLASFVNPVTATVAVLGGLYKAYANSAIGAKDLEFASNQAGAALGIFGNNLARLVSGEEDGEGFFSKLTNGIIKFAQRAAMLAGGGRGGDVSEQTRTFALAQERFEQLQRNLSAVQGDNNERLAENQELQTKILDSATKYEEKIHLIGEMIANLRTNESEILKVKNEELELLKSQVGTQVDQEKLEGQINEKVKEINRIHSDTERKVNGILRAESNLIDVYKKQQAAKRAVDPGLLSDTALAQDIVKTGIKALTPEELQKEQDDRIASETEINALIIEGNQELIESDQKVVDSANARLAAEKSTQEARASIYQKFGNLISQIAGKNKELAIVGVIVQKAAAIGEIIAGLAIANIKAVAASPLTLGMPWVGINTASAVASIASTVFAAGKSVAEISAAAGGGTFYTKKPTLLLVGDNPGGVEKVEVTPISGKGKTKIGKGMMAMAGGGTLVAGMGAPFIGGNFNTGAIGGGFNAGGINQGQLNNLIRSISSRQVAVIIEEVEAKISQRAQIRERAQI